MLFILYISTVGILTRSLTVFSYSWLLRGTKRHQGSNPSQHQPVTANLLAIEHKSLDFSILDNVMLWVAHRLGFCQSRLVYN